MKTTSSKKAAPKKATSLRLSPEAIMLITKLQDRHGLSATAVIEMAVRELARKEKV